MDFKQTQKPPADKIPFINRWFQIWLRRGESNPLSLNSLFFKKCCYVHQKCTKTKIDLRVHHLADPFHSIVNNAFWDCLHKTIQKR